MHIHLPKPLHGWREFLGEVGIIVVGILIALTAEQAVEDFHWRHEVEAGREALKDDMIPDVWITIERESISRCLGHRLQEIATILDQASVSGRLPPVGPIGNPSIRLWHLQAWDNLMASQVATHFPQQDMVALGNIAAYQRTLNALNSDELDQWTTLWTIVGPGRRLAAGEEPQLRQALSRASYDAKVLRVSASQLISIIHDSELLSAEELAKVTKEQVNEQRNVIPLQNCVSRSAPRQRNTAVRR